KRLWGSDRRGRQETKGRRHAATNPKCGPLPPAADASADPRPLARATAKLLPRPRPPNQRVIRQRPSSIPWRPFQEQGRLRFSSIGEMVLPIDLSLGFHAFFHQRLQLVPDPGGILRRADLDRVVAVRGS